MDEEENQVDEQQVAKANKRERNIQNNARALDTAATIAANSGHPVAGAIGHGYKIANKVTGGGLSRTGGKILNTASRLTPGGSIGQHAINGANSLGLDKIAKVKSSSTSDTVTGSLNNSNTNAKTNAKKNNNNNISSLGNNDTLKRNEENSGNNSSDNSDTFIGWWKNSSIITKVIILSFSFLMMLVILFASIFSTTFDSDEMHIAQSVSVASSQQSSGSSTTGNGILKDIFGVNSTFKERFKELFNEGFDELFGRLGSIFTMNSSCTDDCNNSETQFFQKITDISYRYKNLYNLELDWPMITATVLINSADKPATFQANINNYSRTDVNDLKKTMNLDWDYRYDNIDDYLYLDADDSRYDLQLLAKNMVTKETVQSCVSNDGKILKTTTLVDIESELIDEKLLTDNDKTNDYYLKCETGKYVIKNTYKLDYNKYDEFLNEYLEHKFYLEGSGKDNTGDAMDDNYVGNIEFVSNEFGNVYYFNQTDYSDKYYSSDVSVPQYTRSKGGYATIASHGCGPTSVAIVASSLTGETHGPVETTQKVCKAGGCTNGGSSMGALKTVSESYGLKTYYTSGQGVIDALGKPNTLVIALMGPGTFTSGGHYIVLTGVREDGFVSVADPASRTRTNTKWFSFNTVTREAKADFLVVYK